MLVLGVGIGFGVVLCFVDGECLVLVSEIGYVVFGVGNVLEL